MMTVKQQIQINRENNARTLIADKETMSGITSDEKHVSCEMARWSWIDTETDKVVIIGGGVTWVESDELAE